MHLRPPLLETEYTIDVQLPSGRRMALPHCSPQFEPWKGDDASRFSFGRKAFLNWDGEPVFAEILILRLLISAGWEGVWVSSYGGRKFISDMPLDHRLISVDIAAGHLTLLQRIAVVAGSRGGCFDVFAWQGKEIMFCEAKRRGRDRIRQTQLRWLEAALEVGVPESAFLVVDWSPIGNGSATRQGPQRP